MSTSASASASVSRFKRKNAAGSRSDKGWKHGVDVDGDSKKVKCNYCGKAFSGGIYRFKHHLACTHSNVEACVSVPDEVRKEFGELLLRNAELSKKRVVDLDDEEPNKGKGSNSLSQKLSVSSSSKQTTLNQMMKKDLREEACRQFAKWMYTSGIPFNTVRNPEFPKFFELAIRHGVGFKPPTYHEVREKYLKKEVDDTSKLLEQYKAEWKKTGCTIMSDGWSDRKKRSIVNFLVHSPKGTVFITSLDTSGISKTAEVVCDMIDRIVDMVGEDNVTQIVTDNAANYKAAGELLMQKRKRLYWTPCAAHCIDLILEDFKKKLVFHDEIIEKAKRITTYIYSRSMLISMLREFTKDKELLRPGITRFATSYLTLGSLNDHKIALMTLFTSDAWKSTPFSRTEKGKRVALIVLDNDFWKNVVNCLRAAYPLIKVLRLVDGDEPAMGFIYDAMDQAKQKIRENFNNVKRSYEPIWNIIDERWEYQMHRPLHAAAYFLNPQMQYKPDFNADADVKVGLYACLHRMIPDHAVRRKIDAQIEIFKQAEGLFGIEFAIDARETKPPHVWWDAYGDQCPELKKFAIRVLSLTCSSSGCERNWSSFEMVHTKKRNRLHQKKMNDLVFVMHNLKLKETKTRKSKEVKELPAFDDIESDDEWITEDCDIEDLTNDRFSMLDDTEINTEEDAVNQVMSILRGEATQPPEDDLEIRDIFDIGSGSGHCGGGSSGNVRSGDGSSSGIGFNNENIVGDDLF